MSRRHSISLSTIALAIGLATFLGASGCYVYTRGAVVVDEAPPPPRPVHVVARPGFVWVQGAWIRREGQWAWHGGHWQRSRPGYLYIQGRWERRGSRYHWVEPHWQARRGRIRQVRDHRR